jgi:hypothetical protein
VTLSVSYAGYLGIILQGVHEALYDLVNFMALVRQAASILIVLLGGGTVL